MDSVKILNALHLTMYRYPNFFALLPQILYRLFSNWTWVRKNIPV